jgi:hypothetical protein
MQFGRKIARKFFFVQLHCVYKKTAGRRRVHENPQTAWLSRSAHVQPTHSRRRHATGDACSLAVGTSFRAAERQDDGVHARLVAIGAATALLALASCGGKSTPSATTATAAQRPPAAELRWRRQVRAFAAGLVAQLVQVQRATGGGPKAGPIGPRIDERVFAPGPKRRSFLSALTTLERCPDDVARRVPAAPSPLLAPARTALENACDALASAAHSLRDAVTSAGSAGGVDPGALEFARGRAKDGVQLVVDALATVARAASPSGR